MRKLVLVLSHACFLPSLARSPTCSPAQSPPQLVPSTSLCPRRHDYPSVKLTSSTSSWRAGETGRFCPGFPRGVRNEPPKNADEDFARVGDVHRVPKVHTGLDPDNYRSIGAVLGCVPGCPPGPKRLVGRIWPLASNPS